MSRAHGCFNCGMSAWYFLSFLIHLYAISSMPRVDKTRVFSSLHHDSLIFSHGGLLTVAFLIFGFSFTGGVDDNIYSTKQLMIHRYVSSRIFKMKSCFLHSDRLHLKREHL